MANHMNSSRFLTCVADPSRFELLQHLAAGPQCVNDLVAATGQAQSNVSHHLKRLRDCGFVSFDRDGKQNVYRLSDPAVADLLAAIERTRAAIEPLCVAEVC
jgi:DNA-binding transcriptional ArsR family regulator